MSPTSAITASKSSARHVHTRENRCRVTLSAITMPRLSRASAMSSAERPALDAVASVPRSTTRDRRYVAPGASGGSHTDPARTARLIVTAGIVRVCLARTTAPLGRTVRAGERPEKVPEAMALTRTHRLRIEPADGSIGRRENGARRRGHRVARDGSDPQAETAEHVHAGDRLEV